MKRMIIIDSNSLIVLVLGLMNPSLIKNHKRTSIYEEEDYFNLLSVIPNFESIIVLPNIWTEVDNLLNNFSGNYREHYVDKILHLVKSTSEKYFETHKIINNDYFLDLGITDTLILECAKDCNLLVSSDSKLSDYTRAFGIKVYDMKAIKNEKYK